MAQISTDEAVEQLHQMFGDYDKGALAAALEAHGGHMERTVEHLLSSAPDAAADMGGGSGGGSGGGGLRGGVQPSIDHDAALALQLSREWGDDPSLMAPPPTIPSGIPGPYDSMPASRVGASDGVGSMTQGGGVGGSAGSQVSGGNGRRGRRVALPEEFLRLPGWSGGSSATDPQVSADARLAMMLQNESFQRELQSHPELAHLGTRSAGGWGSRSRDMRRKVDELAVRWRMKDPGRAEDTTGYSSVPLMSGQDDADDQAEVVHFAQDGTTRRSSAGSSGGGGYSSGVPVTSGAPSGGSLFREDSGEERLADPRRSKKDR